MAPYPCYRSARGASATITIRRSLRPRAPPASKPMAIRNSEPENRVQHAWQAAVQRLFALDFRQALTLCSVLFVIFAVTDYVTPPELNLTFMYVLIILLACWNLGAKWGLVFTVLASVMQV